MQCFVPYLVYQNVRCMAKNYRYLDIITEELKEEEFRKEIQYSGLIRIDAEDGENHRKREPRLTSIIIMGIGSKYIKASADFTNYMNKVIGRNNEARDILVVSNEAPSTFIHKKIKELSKNNIRIFIYDYNVFKLEVPKHKFNAPHTLLSPDEVEELMHNLYVKEHNLPKIIAHKDPTAIWYGFEKGDIVKINAVSDISGQKIIYRLAI